MLVLTIVTVLQFCKLRHKMLVRPINFSLWYDVKDNVVLQALCPSSNCLYTKSKSTVLLPLKGELGYELSRSKWSNSDLSSSGFLLSDWLNFLMVLLNRPFSHFSHGWQRYFISMFICYIPPSTAFTFSFPKLFVHVFNRESYWDTSLGFLPERFSKSIENNNHSRMIYRNDNITRLGKT